MSVLLINIYISPLSPTSLVVSSIGRPRAPAKHESFARHSLLATPSLLEYLRCPALFYSGLTSVMGEYGGNPGAALLGECTYNAVAVSTLLTEELSDCFSDGYSL